MLKRHEARELAFQILFEKSFSEDPIDDIIELAKQVRGIETDEYVERVTKGVCGNIDAVDELIVKYSVGRSKARLSRVVLSLLRLSIFEIMMENGVEPSISINEAVELAKEYSTDEEARYINGVLGSIVRAGEKVDFSAAASENEQ